MNITTKMTARLLLSAAILTCFCACGFSADAKPPGAPLRILQIRGLHFQYYRLDEAAKLLGADTSKVAYGYTRGDGKRGVSAFPASAAELAQFDLVCMNDIPLAPLPTGQMDESQVKLLRTYVEGGGALLVLGGHNALAGGGYGKGLLAEVLPVQVKARFDIEWLKPPGVIQPLSHGGLGIEDTKWKESPAVVWPHQFDGVKPGAETLATVGGKPAIVIGRCQQGMVGVVGLTAYGAPPKGSVPFWDWPEWPKVMAETMKRLLKKGELK